MNLISEIFDWAKSQPLWIQEAVRRLNEKPAGLSDIDFKELMEVCIGDRVVDSSSPIQNPRDALNVNRTKGAFSLVALGRLENVNKIDSAQELTFGPSGLTIIYGNNGTGKSGYSRVFKHACFSRDKGETILPDITDQDSLGNPAQAEFTICENGINRKIKWVDTIDSKNSPLSEIAVFDANVARIAVSKAQECSFVPYGLDIVQNLGNVVVPQIKKLIEEKIKAIDINTSRFDEFKGEDAIGQLFNNLMRATIDDVRRASIFTEYDLARGKQLREAIELSDTQGKISNIRNLVSRLKKVAKEFGRKETELSESNVLQWREARDEVETARKATELAIEFFKDEDKFIAGTGDEAWRLMFESARSFACQSKKGQGSEVLLARCVLCQQDLNDAARCRMIQFDEFINADATARLKRAEGVLKGVISAIEKMEGFKSFDEILFKELACSSADVAEEISRQINALDKRKKDIVAALNGRLNWDCITTFTKGFEVRVRSFAAGELRKAHLLRLASDEQMRQKMIAEKKVLEKRYKLSRRISEVEAWFARYKVKARLENILAGLSSTPYTNKAKEFFSQAVTEPLVTALNKEFHEIGVDRMFNMVAPVTKGEKGRALYKLVLPKAKSIQIPQVLSEGEQKAIGIASFMAELSVGTGCNPIVFDDPVSSLDITFREAIAKRFANEAEIRQVIVFSHDPLFVCQLEEFCRRNNVELHTRHLENQDGRVGMPLAGLPWELGSLESRIDELEKIQKQMERIPWPLIPNAEQTTEMRVAYGRLRAVVEQFVRDRCLGGVVRRFDDYIKVSRLANVLALDMKIIKEVQNLYTKCHGVVLGHDHSTYGMKSLPTDKDLAFDIATLKQLLKRVKTQQKNLDIAREKVENAAAVEGGDGNEGSREM